jgi:hypothetical protein
MTHVTTLLIVLALTGGPVADAICVSWCDSGPMTKGATCDESVAEPMSIAISDGSSTCAALLADSPFLREEGRIVFHTSSRGIFHALNTRLEGRAWLARIRIDGKAIDGQLGPPLVLRL